MFNMKRDPVSTISLITLFIIIAYLAVGASGFRGVIPGSMLFSQKGSQGYYVFHRLLEELDYSVEFEKQYGIPSVHSSTIVYASANKESFSNEDYMEWLKQGNTLVLIGDSTALLLDNETILSGEPLLVRDTYNRNPAHGALYASDYFSKEGLRNLNRVKILYKTSRGAVIAESFVGEGRVLFISDQSLFNNGNMHNLQNARLLNDLFQPLKDSPLYMRERSPEAIYDSSVISGLLEGKGSYISLQILILFILFVLIMGKRFARPEKLSARQRRKVTEHVKAVGLFYQKADAFKLIESIDSDYFKTITCKNQKPSNISPEEYKDFTVSQDKITEAEVIQRFKKRQILNKRLENRSEYES